MTPEPQVPVQTLACLLGKYGPLMTAGNLAEVLGRASEVSVRNQLRITTSDFSRLFSPSAVRIGRRLLFRTELIARALDDLPLASKGA